MQGKNSGSIATKPPSHLTPASSNSTNKKGSIYKPPTIPIYKKPGSKQAPKREINNNKDLPETPAIESIKIDNDNVEQLSEAGDTRKVKFEEEKTVEAE